MFMDHEKAAHIYQSEFTKFPNLCGRGASMPLFGCWKGKALQSATSARRAAPRRASPARRRRRPVPVPVQLVQFS